MTRKFEIKTQDCSPWLNHLQRIAEFCADIGREADYARKPLTLHLVIYPEDKDTFHRLPKLPCN